MASDAPNALPQPHGGVLYPAQKGEVRNPEGKNQWSYRKDAEARFERLVQSPDERDPDKTVAEALIEQILKDARDSYAGADRRHARDIVMDRLLPKPTPAQINVTNNGGVVTFAALVQLAREDEGG